MFLFVVFMVIWIFVQMFADERKRKRDAEAEAKAWEAWLRR